jgi:membrane protein DedA with SNARE-associated domain
MTDIANTLVQYGYPVVVLVIALESLGAPVPGETLMIALAAAAAAGNFNIRFLFVAIWAGSVLGDNAGYLIGRRWGHRAIDLFGSRVGLTERRYRRMRHSFSRYGTAVVVFARFFVVFRQLNGIMAGSLGLPWWRFLVANMIGAALWAGFWLYAGASVSSRLMSALIGAHKVKLVFIALAVGAAIVVLVAAFVLHRKSARK